MTVPTPLVIPIIEYPESPQDAIETRVAFPPEPEPKKDTCPTLRLNHGDRIPEENPAIAAIETETETVIETAIETATALAVEVLEAISSPGGAAQAGAAIGANPNQLP